MSCYLSQLSPKTVLCVKQTYYDDYDVMTKEDFLADQRYTDFLLGNDTVEVYIAEKIYPSKVDLYQVLEFFCADEMPENWLDAAYDAIANAIDIESFEQKINNALRNVYAWDLGEVVLID